MGIYVVSLGLSCDSTDGAILQRFQEVWDIAAKKACGLFSYDSFDAPDGNGDPPVAFLNALHDKLKTVFHTKILADLTLTGGSVVQVSVFSAWSSPGGEAPHEGGPTTATVTAKDSSGNTISPNPMWKITRNMQTAYVKAYALWRYLDV